MEIYFENKRRGLASRTSPGFDKAISRLDQISNNEGIVVGQFCNCNLRNRCNLSVSIDRLAGQITVKGGCLKT